MQLQRQQLVQNNSRNSDNKMSQSTLTTIKTLGFWAVCMLIACVGLIQVVGAMQLVEPMDQNGRQASSSSSANGNTASLALIESPELTARVLENLLRSVVLSLPTNEYPILNGAQKRGLDLGISRGFSGSQAGKHLMGLSAASFANGPGRR